MKLWITKDQNFRTLFTCNLYNFLTDQLSERSRRELCWTGSENNSIFCDFDSEIYVLYGFIDRE